MAIILDGSGLTIEKIVKIARLNEKVELSSDALERIKICRAMLEKKVDAKEIMYGVNTGIGEFSEVPHVSSFGRTKPAPTTGVSAKTAPLSISGCALVRVRL